MAAGGSQRPELHALPVFGIAVAVATIASGLAALAREGPTRLVVLLLEAAAGALVAYGYYAHIPVRRNVAWVAAAAMAVSGLMLIGLGGQSESRGGDGDGTANTGPRTDGRGDPQPSGGPGTSSSEPGAQTPSMDPTPTAPPITYAETTGSTSNTFTDYVNAGGSMGPQIGAQQTVQIACRVVGLRMSNGNSWWYRVASEPWSNAYYAPADNFYNNGATSGSLVGTPFVDPAVPNC